MALIQFMVSEKIRVLRPMDVRASTDTCGTALALLTQSSGAKNLWHFEILSLESMGKSLNKQHREILIVESIG